MVINICNEAKTSRMRVRYDGHMEGVVHYHARNNLHELSGSEILQGTVGGSWIEQGNQFGQTR